MLVTVFMVKILPVAVAVFPLSEFDKPLGSSHNDELDLRDVARKAAKKSQ